MKSRLIMLANALAVFAALLAIWQLVLWIFHVPPYMLPSPWAVARAVGSRFPSLVAALATTAAEAGGGLIASIVVGVTVRRERRWTSAGATPARELVRSTR